MEFPPLFPAAAPNKTSLSVNTVKNSWKIHYTKKYVIKRGNARKFPHPVRPSKKQPL